MNRHLDEISAACRILLHLGVVNLLLKVELRDRTALDFDLDEAGARSRQPSGVADRNSLSFTISILVYVVNSTIKSLFCAC